MPPRKGTRTIRFTLDIELVDWLESLPGGGGPWISQIVREHMEKGRRIEVEITPETRALLDSLAHKDVRLAERASQLVRYPQLIEAVAKEFVSIDRAEAMAEEADSRA